MSFPFPLCTYHLYYLFLYFLICVCIHIHTCVCAHAHVCFPLWKINYEGARALTRLFIPVPPMPKIVSVTEKVFSNYYWVSERLAPNDFFFLAPNDFWAMFPQQLEIRLLPIKSLWSTQSTNVKSDFYRSGFECQEYTALKYREMGYKDSKCKWCDDKICYRWKKIQQGQRERRDKSEQNNMEDRRLRRPERWTQLSDSCNSPA